MSDVWAECGARARCIPLAGEVLRLVESQEQVATRGLVATLAEQELLESLLEAAKPPLPPATRSLHYLLSTPFRYPPLRYGSRFGGRHEPSLFYASRSVDTVLAESAFYRYVFWEGMATPPSAPLRTEHTLFGARVRTRKAYDLRAPPFDAHRERLTSPGDYTATQALGTALRAAGAEAIEFESARDAGRGSNVALFTPRAFAATRPTFSEEWLCETQADCVSFYARGREGVRSFARQQFTVAGALPRPAA